MYTCRGIYLHIQLESESMQMRLTNTKNTTHPFTIVIQAQQYEKCIYPKEVANRL